MEFLSILLALFPIIYLAYIHPKQEKREDRQAFDNRVLAVIDGLYISGMKFGCTDSEMRHYAMQMLEKAHKLPSGQYLFDYTITNRESKGYGRTFKSRIGLHGEHIHFALLCIIHRVDSYYHADTIAQCEQLLLETPNSSIFY